MRKNQKYTQEEMYLTIEIWQESSLSMKDYCAQEKISCGTFAYWLRKFKKEQTNSKEAIPTTFIPVEVSSQTDLKADVPIDSSAGITINYPSGIQVVCPADINNHQLVSLIKL